MKKPVIICVDDEKIILDSLEEQLLSRLGSEFDVELAEGGEEGLEIIQDLIAEKTHIAVIISDQLMPGIKGDEFLIAAHKITPDTQKILLTGQASIESVKNAINNARLYRYVNKPWEENDLMLTVEEAARSFMNGLQVQEYNRLLKGLNKASQEISGEVEYKRLITKLINNVVDTIGVEQGYLFFDNAGKLNIEILAAFNKNEQKTLLEKLETAPAELNKTVTQRLVASIEGDDLPYAFTAPITKKGRTMGYLYLENQYSKRPFTHYQKEIIQMLASQAAISIDNANLYSRIEERSRELQTQKEIIEEKNKDITDSIRYAKRIQEAIMPEKEMLQHYFQDSFILYRPKDIVSGDFYWFMEKYHKFLIAAVDCTGHGVPGAFMSVIGSNLLNQIVNEYGILEPEAVLDHLHFRVKVVLKQDTEAAETNDGMDVAFCAIDPENHIVQFAGANRPLIIVRNGAIIDHKPDKHPIGGNQMEDISFTGNTIPLEHGDCLYIFTDGIPDQFGGENNKKFTSRKLYQIFQDHADKPMQEIGQILRENLILWQGREEQTDDNLIIGIRYLIS